MELDQRFPVVWYDVKAVMAEAVTAFFGGCMEEQMRMLCSVWKDAWQGMVMAEIFWKEGTPKASCGVHVKEGRLIRLSACTDGGELSMVLLPFHAGKCPRKEREG